MAAGRIVRQATASLELRTTSTGSEGSLKGQLVATPSPGVAFTDPALAIPSAGRWVY